MPPPLGVHKQRCSCLSLLMYFFFFFAAFWGGGMCCYLYMKSNLRPAAAAASAATSLRPPAATAASAVAAASTPTSALSSQLLSVMSSLRVLPWERLPLVHYSLRLTGHPPLVSRGDLTADGSPDMENFGLAPDYPAMSFFMVDPWEGSSGEGLQAAQALSDSPLRYLVQSEDSVRDIAVAMLASPGKVRGKQQHRTCQASPVTVPFGCLASLRALRPALFAKGGQPLPASQGGPLVIDIGYTGAGYYALLAASQGVSSLAVDTQPQCALWGRLAAQASGLQGLATTLAALPYETLGSRATVAAPVRTGCTGTSTTEGHAAQQRVRSFYGKSAQARQERPSDSGREAAVAARRMWHTEQEPEGLGDVGGGEEVALPAAAMDDILCATYPAMCPAAPPGSTPPTVLLLKIDARGREALALVGLQRLLTSSSPPLNIVLELNKQHTALAMRLPSALEAAKGAGIEVPKQPSDLELVQGLGLPAFTLSEADNQSVAEEFVGIVQQFLELGYEVLVADRGWWAAQDPWREVNLDKFKPLAEGVSLEDWGLKFNARGEVDICACLGGGCCCCCCACACHHLTDTHHTLTLTQHTKPFPLCAQGPTNLLRSRARNTRVQHTQLTL